MTKVGRPLEYTKKVMDYAINKSKKHKPREVRWMLKMKFGVIIHRNTLLQWRAR